MFITYKISPAMRQGRNFRARHLLDASGERTIFSSRSLISRQRWADNIFVVGTSLPCTIIIRDTGKYVNPYEKIRPGSQDGTSIFFRPLAYSGLRFHSQPLLKAPHSKAFRYAAILQRFGRHTPFPTFIFYCMQNP